MENIYHLLISRWIKERCGVLCNSVLTALLPQEHVLPEVSAVGHRLNNTHLGAMLILGLSVSFHTVRMTRWILRRRFRALVGGSISGNSWEMSHYHFNVGLLLELWNSEQTDRETSICPVLSFCLSSPYLPALRKKIPTLKSKLLSEMWHIGLKISVSLWLWGPEIKVSHRIPAFLCCFCCKTFYMWV